MADEKRPTVVAIPGTFYAEVTGDAGEHLEVARFVFVPSASDAGYFGPSAEVVDYDDTDDDDAAGLDTENVDGPFWRAVQRGLQPTMFYALGSDDESMDQERTTAPFVWEE